MNNLDMKHTWSELDRRLSEHLAEPVTGRFFDQHAWSAFRGVHRVLWAEVAMNLALAVLAGSYVADHIGTFRFAFPAATLQLVAIAATIAAAAQLVALGRLSYGEPVVALQHRLESLRVMRTRVHRWLLILAPLLWTPLAIVCAEALFGVDVYETFGGRWVAANLAFGLAVIIAAIVFSRRFADRMRGHSIARAVAESLAGYTVTRAVASIDEIAAFHKAG